ncbi:hypothetical protein M2447_001395 [Ereboglobus sp. PH5-10]|uniref:NotI family restriction endonuclease n=1 Tax=Ereboglobus sp. PH5-10 TaxID=2940629 RepID=UPI002404F98B|nr:NotI family restriction endonuclease [Ereboglobus sp. PH5-10]MDF9827303.1 hypothetical protein [Ereboglobus sp. PH5-10]
MPLKPNLNQPLAEVFGYPINNQSPEAIRARRTKLCPFYNKVPNCTKDKAKNPLGVCSVYDGANIVSTCPVRFREDWLIATDAAEFFFDTKAKWTTLTEIRLQDEDGRSAGNIDVVIVAYDDNGKIYDFGALEVQAVYISGNVRNPFEYYMQDCPKRASMNWLKQENYPNPDFLSSSRKRLAPQLIYKGGILNAWNKKTAVALDRHFFATLPTLERVPKKKAEMAWFIYDFKLQSGRYKMVLDEIVYTQFAPALNKITRSRAGNVGDFLKKLQNKLDEKLETPPTTETLQVKLSG